MKDYFVEFAASADLELFESYIWGCNEWGIEAANKWARNMRKVIRKMLESFPVSQPIAPDNDQFEFETRQMIVGRYRILFTIQGTTVTVFHIRGPYTG